MELIVSLALGLSIWLLYPADASSVKERSFGGGGTDLGSESGEGVSPSDSTSNIERAHSDDRW